jgi:hypothetical protein
MTNEAQAKDKDAKSSAYRNRRPKVSKVKPRKVRRMRRK